MGGGVCVMFPKGVVLLRSELVKLRGVKGEVSGYTNSLTLFTPCDPERDSSWSRLGKWEVVCGLGP
jgi:hypothetical protein